MLKRRSFSTHSRIQTVCKLLCISVLLSCISACETTNHAVSRYLPMLPWATPTALLPDDDPIIPALTGKHVNYVRSVLGLPNRRDEIYDDLMIWTYVETQRGMTAVSCELSLAIRDDLVEHVAVSPAHETAASYMGEPCAALRYQSLRDPRA